MTVPQLVMLVVLAAMLVAGLYLFVTPGRSGRDADEDQRGGERARYWANEADARRRGADKATSDEASASDERPVNRNPRRETARDEDLGGTMPAFSRDAERDQDEIDHVTPGYVPTTGVITDRDTPEEDNWFFRRRTVSSPSESSRDPLMPGHLVSAEDEPGQPRPQRPNAAVENSSSQAVRTDSGAPAGPSPVTGIVSPVAASDIQAIPAVDDELAASLDEWPSFPTHAEAPVAAPVIPEPVDAGPNTDLQEVAIPWEEAAPTAPAAPEVVDAELIDLSAPLGGEVTRRPRAAFDTTLPPWAFEGDTDRAEAWDRLVTSARAPQPARSTHIDELIAQYFPESATTSARITPASTVWDDEAGMRSQALSDYELELSPLTPVIETRPLRLPTPPAAPPAAPAASNGSGTELSTFTWSPSTDTSWATAGMSGPRAPLSSTELSMVARQSAQEWLARYERQVEERREEARLAEERRQEEIRREKAEREAAHQRELAERAEELERLREENLRLAEEREQQAELARLEQERLAVEQAAELERLRQENERLAAERERDAELARLEQERLQAEREQEAELARLEQERLEAEREREAEEARAEAERVAAERLREAEEAKAESERVEAELMAAAEEARQEAEREQERAHAAEQAAAELARQREEVAQRAAEVESAAARAETLLREAQEREMQAAEAAQAAEARMRDLVERAENRQLDAAPERRQVTAAPADTIVDGVIEPDDEVELVVAEEEPEQPRQIASTASSAPVPKAAEIRKRRKVRAKAERAAGDNRPADADSDAWGGWTGEGQ